MMKNVYRWLTAALARRPLVFTVVSGILYYTLAIAWLVIYAQPVIEAWDIFTKDRSIVVLSRLSKEN